MGDQPLVDQAIQNVIGGGPTDAGTLGDRRHRRLAQFERSQIEASFLAGKAQLGKLIKQHHSLDRKSVV